MALFIIVALVVVAMNITEMSAILALIFKSAFGLESVASGGAGYLVSRGDAR